MLRPGEKFPDWTLPDQDGQSTSISSLMRPGLLDKALGFDDGYPLIIVFYRGYFCPRDNQQMRLLVEFQDELDVNFGRLAAISVEDPVVQAAFRNGLGARWTFLSDSERALVDELGILDETEGERAFPARPFTFVLAPDMEVRAIYDGWFFVGRPTLDELRIHLREIMSESSRYTYAAYATPEATQVRVPQQDWLDGAPELGANGLGVTAGTVLWFDRVGGNGMIERADDGGQVFFNFTAVPGEGYVSRILRAGTEVRFEVVEGPAGQTARNVQRADS